jgi:5,10-methenyltetrahydromethanopterin hydrogenase
MTNVYRFVGAVTHAADMEFNAVGQRADFTEQYFAEVVEGGASFLPDEEFEREFEDFDPALLAQYSDPYYFGTRSADYDKRVEACRERVRQLRASLLAEKAAQTR